MLVWLSTNGALPDFSVLAVIVVFGGKFRGAL